MKHALLPIALAGLLLIGAGCGKAPEEPSPASDTNANAPAEASATSTTEVAATSTPATNSNAPAPKPTNPPKPSGSSAVRKTFYVEFDDKGAYPGSGTAAKGSTVTVTFKVRPTNVFYNNLIVKSSRHDLGLINAGASETITFTATEDETFVAQWSTGQTKARWTLIVR